MGMKQIPNCVWGSQDSHKQDIAAQSLFKVHIKWLWIKNILKLVQLYILLRNYFTIIILLPERLIFFSPCELSFLHIIHSSDQMTTWNHSYHSHILKWIGFYSLVTIFKISGELIYGTKNVSILFSIKLLSWVQQ